jgi:cobalamin synthase
MIIWRIHIILGGITGDVVGMLVEISQVVFLLTLAIVN